MYRDVICLRFALCYYFCCFLNRGGGLVLEIAKYISKQALPNSGNYNAGSRINFRTTFPHSLF